MPPDLPSINSLFKTVAATSPDVLGDRLADMAGSQRGSRDSTGDYDCKPAFSAPTDHLDDDTVAFAVNAGDCPHHGSLLTSAPCYVVAVEALGTRDADRPVVRVDGSKHRYGTDATGLLVAAGRFVERVRFRDGRLADCTRDDPLGATHETMGRTGPVRRITVETRLTGGASRSAGYDDALQAVVEPTPTRSRVDPRLPAGGQLAEVADLDTGVVTCRYECPCDPVYHFTSPESMLDQRVVRTLEAAHDRLAHGIADVGPRASGRVIRLAVDADAPVETLAVVLAKHTMDNDVLDDSLSDPTVLDTYVSTLVNGDPICVVVDGALMSTNVRLVFGSAESLAPRLRCVSDASFSRADPTLDTVIRAGSANVRVAGVTAPTSGGLGFAFRCHNETPLALPVLVTDGALSAGAVTLYSLVVEHGTSVLVVGFYGAGKTTFLDSFLQRLSCGVRTVLIEDTPELPASSLFDVGRDVQSFRTNTTGGPEPTPRGVLHVVFRLGDGTLTLSEVRGEEVAVLCEVMRVGANASAVLGTIHDDGAVGVRERAVFDLGVPASLSAVTDLVATCEHADEHRVVRVEKVRPVGDDAAFGTLFEHDERVLEPTGSVARGDSPAVEFLVRLDKSYADVLDALDARATHPASFARTGRTAPDDLTATHTERGSGY